MESVTRDIIFRVKYETDSASARAAADAGSAISRAQNDSTSAWGRARAEAGKYHRDIISQIKEQQAAMDKLRQSQTSAASSVQQNAQRSLEGVNKLTNGVLSLARAWAVNTAANEQDAEKALRNLAKYESALQGIRGISDIAQGGSAVLNMARGGAAAGAAGAGAGIGAAAAPVLAFTAAVGAAAAALYSLKEAAKGDKYDEGTPYSWVAKQYANAGRGVVGATTDAKGKSGFFGGVIQGVSGVVPGWDREAFTDANRTEAMTKRLMREQEQIRRNFSADLSERMGRISDIRFNAENGIAGTRDPSQQRALAQDAISRARGEQNGPGAAGAYRLEADMLRTIIGLEEDRVTAAQKGLSVEQSKLGAQQKNLDLLQRIKQQEEGKYASAVNRLAGMDAIEAGQFRQAADKANAGQRLSIFEAQRLEGFAGFENRVMQSKERQVKDLGLDQFLAPLRAASKQATEAERRMQLDVQTQSQVVVKLEGEIPNIVAAVTEAVKKDLTEIMRLEAKARQEDQRNQQTLQRQFK